MKLTVTASNKNRLVLGSNASIWFLKSIQWQTFTDFELLIADGGSDNYEEIKEYFANHEGSIPMRIVQHKIGDTFHRALLNNVGVRHGKGEYVMTTDVDMIFEKDFMATLMSLATPTNLVESRTLYLKPPACAKIYNETVDPLNDWHACKGGRIKKRSTAGGCQAMHKDSWAKLHGFDERYYGWGSEDQDLIVRAKMAKLNVVWMGEQSKPSDIRLFHQYHPKPDLKKDLEDQAKNKKLLRKIQKYAVNAEEWGGLPV